MNRPDHFTEHEENIISNFDHKIMIDVADAIKDKPLFSHYPGWNFNGQVWWHNGLWHCDVWVYGSCVETISNSDLSILKEIICNKYGYD